MIDNYKNVHFGWLVAVKIESSKFYLGRHLMLLVIQIQLSIET
jgi:hypothetical protein